jgi:hypothetical protein
LFAALVSAPFSALPRHCCRGLYTEELTHDVMIVTAEYVSSRTGESMTNYGLRVYLKSHRDLHFTPHDDDRSAVTLWCGRRDDIGKLVQAMMRCYEECAALAAGDGDRVQSAKSSIG